MTASFLAPYKRTDLVIAAFNAMPSRRLLVVGDGQQSVELRKMAGPNIKFAGFLPRQDYVRAVAQAQALVFAGCEDFGIALAEAQAWGTPLVAFGRGGASDIVRPLGRSKQPTGVLFERQTMEAVRDAVEHFVTNRAQIEPAACRENALRFSVERFRREINAAFARTVDLHRQGWAREMPELGFVSWARYPAFYLARRALRSTSSGGFPSTIDVSSRGQLGHDCVGHLEV